VHVRYHKFNWSRLGKRFTVCHTNAGEVFTAWKWSTLYELKNGLITFVFVLIFIVGTAATRCNVPKKETSVVQRKTWIMMLSSSMSVSHSTTLQCPSGWCTHTVFMTEVNICMYLLYALRHWFVAKFRTLSISVITLPCTVCPVCLVFERLRSRGLTA
jgi:hypothetical protein